MRPFLNFPTLIPNQKKCYAFFLDQLFIGQKSAIWLLAFLHLWPKQTNILYYVHQTPIWSYKQVYACSRQEFVCNLWWVIWYLMKSLKSDIFNVCSPPLQTIGVQIDPNLDYTSCIKLHNALYQISYPTRPLKSSDSPKVSCKWRTVWCRLDVSDLHLVELCTAWSSQCAWTSELLANCRKHSRLSPPPCCLSLLCRNMDMPTYWEMHQFGQHQFSTVPSSFWGTQMLLHGYYLQMEPHQSSWIWIWPSTQQTACRLWFVTTPCAFETVAS